MQKYEKKSVLLQEILQKTKNDMKLALIGYGKMGKAIEAVALERGHSIVAKIDNEEDWSRQASAMKECDVALEFTTPTTAVENIRRCLMMGLRTVVGTTGWYEQQPEMEALCKTQGGALFVASNFSIGMNIMMAMNRQLASIMNQRPEYGVRIRETHHIHKLDAPSGTAIHLAKECIAGLEAKHDWQLVEEGSRVEEGILPVSAYREGENPGEHAVVYESEMDTLTIEHKAKSRKGLALGAVLAAEFLQGKQGVFGMREMLGI